MSNIPTELLNMLEAFLAEHSPSDGGWAPVGKDDIGDLGDIIATIIEAKYDEDADGDLPVDWQVTDRTRYERYNPLDVPHCYRIKAREYREEGISEECVLYERVECASANLQMAQGRMNDVVRDLERYFQKKLETQE